ncbi:MAG: RDD family protein [Chloracidobacterium sp.]|nr:RDD family protein [Chloracidobacterium sp.]
MKCESCGNELIGAVIICRACNHNNTLQNRLSVRRPEPRHNTSTQSHGDPLEELPTINPRKDTDVNLLHFPSNLHKPARAAQPPQARQTVAESEREATSFPPWRDELKERIRRIKEKRALSELAAPNPSPVQPSRAKMGEAKLGRNQIVESALKRLKLAARKTDEQRDGETEGQRNIPPLSRSGSGLSVSTLSAPSHMSISKPSVSWPTAGALEKQPDKQTDKRVKTRVQEIAQYGGAKSCVSTSRPKADPASLFTRVLAASCDFEIVILACLLIFGAYSASNNAASFSDGSRLFLALALSAVIFIYQIVMLAFAGRTFGMALLKLNLVNTGDENLPVALWQKLLRALVSTIMFICFPLHLTIWFSASRRTLPDLVSGTTVA